MPDYDSRASDPYPYPTAAEVEAAPGNPATRAARNIAVRHFGGIPRRAFLLGGADHSPIMQGLTEFTESVQQLLDALPNESDPNVRETAQKVHDMMVTHGCK